MQLVEQHDVKKSDPDFAVIDAAAFAAKNLYNLANSEVRQSYFHQGCYLDNVKVYHRVKHTEASAGPCPPRSPVIISCKYAFHI